MKKILSLLLILGLCVGLVGCGGGSSKTPEETYKTLKNKGYTFEITEDNHVVGKNKNGYNLYLYANDDGTSICFERDDKNYCIINRNQNNHLKTSHIYGNCIVDIATNDSLNSDKINTDEVYICGATDMIESDKYVKEIDNYINKLKVSDDNLITFAKWYIQSQTNTYNKFTDYNKIVRTVSPKKQEKDKANPTNKKDYFTASGRSEAENWIKKFKDAGINIDYYINYDKDTNINLIYDYIAKINFNDNSFSKDYDPKEPLSGSIEVFDSEYLAEERYDEIDSSTGTDLNVVFLNGKVLLRLNRSMSDDLFKKYDSVFESTKNSLNINRYTTSALNVDEYISKVKAEIQKSVASDERILSVNLSNKELLIKVDLSQCDPSPLTIEDLAITRTSSITDNILELTEHYDLWNVITVDFGAVGKISNSKDDIKSNGYSNYFPSSGFILK